MRQSPDLSGSILILRTSAMGDVAMLRPVLIGLRSKYPTTRLALLTDPFFKPVFDGIDGLEILSFDKSLHGSPLGLWRLYRSLRSTPFEAVLDLHAVLRSRLLSAFFRLGGTPTATIDKGRAERRALLKEGWQSSRPLTPMHLRYAAVFNRLGFELGPADLSVEHNGSGASPVIGIAPFARHPGKAYPPGQMETVIEGLLTSTKAEIALYGGPGKEAAQLEEWAGRHPGRVHNRASGLDFKCQLQSMKNLSLMISMDSANGHLAANFGVPVLTIWGTTHPYMGFAPFGQAPGHQLVPDPARYPRLPVSVFGPCKDPYYLGAIGSIPPETIVSKVLEILGLDPHPNN